MVRTAEGIYVDSCRIVLWQKNSTTVGMDNWLTTTRCMKQREEKHGSGFLLLQ